MKLRNKKTGEIIDTLCRDDITKGISFGIDHHDGNPTMAYYNSLAKLNKDWEDYEEPKDFWYIDDFAIMCGQEGEFTTPDLGSFTKRDIERLKEIGNYFETKEEAEKTVEKLKAWKRLKDKGFRFDGLVRDAIYYEISDEEIEKDIVRNDLNLLFGGKE